MNWFKQLALLNWQGQIICLEDFKRLKSSYKNIQGFEDFQDLVTHPKTKKFILENKNWWKQGLLFQKICEDHDIQLTWPYHTNYPQTLLYYSNSPTLISYKGSPCWNKHFQLCVVGSRKGSPLTLSWMDHHLLSFLKKNDVCLLSGGARGIDQKGHSLSIQAQKPTLCFLPCGIKKFYPKELQQWESYILQNKGAFISIFPPNWDVFISNFHIRNSLMVRMSQITFVLQAAQRSGSMLTAQFAINYGVSLCTLPGPVMNPLFKGNLSLLNDGVLMIRDEKDLESLYHVQRIHDQPQIEI